MEPETGLGHQYRNEEKILECCGKSLLQACNDLIEINNPEINTLKLEILQLVNKVMWLSYSAREKSKLNQD